MGQYIIGGPLKVGGDIDIGTSKLMTSVANGNVEIAANGTGKVKIGNLYMPADAGSNGNVLAVDGSGNLSFVSNSQSVGHTAVNYTAADTSADSHFAGIDTELGDLTTALAGKLTTVADDTTPQLGGNLDVNGNSLVSTANGNIVLAPNGTGAVVVGGMTVEKKADLTITDDNTVGSAVYSYTAAGNDAVFIDYVLHRGVDGTKYGTLALATDGTAVDMVATGGEMGATGVTFTAAIAAGTVTVSYTSTATGNSGVMAFTVRRWGVIA